MENFSLTEDLLRYQGASVCSLDYMGRKRNVVIIPVDWNDIDVRVNNEGKVANAFSYLRGWQTSKSYQDACIKANGDKEGFTVPSHLIYTSYSEDFEKKMKDALAENLRKLPENTSLSDEDLAKKASYELRDRQRVGSMRVLAKKEKSTLQGDAPELPTSAPEAFNQEVSGRDDLPF